MVGAAWIMPIVGETSATGGVRISGLVNLKELSGLIRQIYEKLTKLFYRDPKIVRDLARSP